MVQKKRKRIIEEAVHVDHRVRNRRIGNSAKLEIVKR